MLAGQFTRMSDPLNDNAVNESRYASGVDPIAMTTAFTPAGGGDTAENVVGAPVKFPPDTDFPVITTGPTRSPAEIDDTLLCAAENV